MKIGYSRQATVKERREKQKEKFSTTDVDELIIDPYMEQEVYPDNSRFGTLLTSLEVGDILVIPALSSVSNSAVVWTAILAELMAKKVNLHVLNLPSLSMTNLREVVASWREIERQSSNKSRIISIEKESLEDRKRLTAFSRQQDNRQQYWVIFKELQRGASLRRTAKRQEVSQGTVLRIKREVAKFRQALLLIATFLLTVICLKIAQAYSDNLGIQLFICIIATILIGYFTYSDIKEADA